MIPPSFILHVVCGARGDVGGDVLILKNLHVYHFMYRRTNQLDPQYLPANRKFDQALSCSFKELQRSDSTGSVMVA